MDIILLEKMGRLGSLGDRVAVKAGYARNFLYPKGKAVPATAENITKFDARRAELEKAAAALLQTAKSRADSLQNLTVRISHKASEEGRLFGSVGTKDLADAISKAGVSVHKSEVRLPNGALRQIGEYDIQLHLHADIDVTVKVSVVPEA